MVLECPLALCVVDVAKDARAVGVIVGVDGGANAVHDQSYYLGVQINVPTC